MAEILMDFKSESPHKDFNGAMCNKICQYLRYPSIFETDNK